MWVEQNTAVNDRAKDTQNKRERGCLALCSQGFSPLALWIFQARSFFVLGAALCFERCLAAFLALTHQTPIANPPSAHPHGCDNQNVSRHCQMSPERGEKNHPWMRTTEVGWPPNNLLYLPCLLLTLTRVINPLPLPHWSPILCWILPSL